MKIHQHHVGHMTKMAAMPIYGKKTLKIFFPATTGPILMKLCMAIYHGGNTIGLTCAVDRVSRIPYMLKPAVDQVYRQPYSLGQQPISLVSFTDMALESLNYTPCKLCVVSGYTVFTLSVFPSVCPSVTFCFLNIFKRQ